MGTAKIVAFTGFAGAGKSEASKYLVNNHGYTLLKFASGLKDMLKALGLSHEQIEGRLKEVPSHLLCGKTPRHAMITLGTEWGRDLIGGDLWTNVLLSKIESLESLYRCPKVVIDDCRFINEASMIQRKGGLIVEVVRPGVGPVSNHQSEMEHLEFKGVELLHNDAGVPGLWNLLDSLLLMETQKCM